jgi:uncharacterized repeat protein (TIGR03803 family)
MRWNRLLQSLTSSSLTLSAVLALGGLAWAGSTYKVLYSFKGGSDGGGLHGGVALAGNGNLYGKTSGGGAHGYGTVFELTRGVAGEWTKSTLHSFCSETRCRDGAASFYGVTVNAAGILYGTSNTATFELSRRANGWSFSIISNNAALSGLTIDGAGNLYGAGGSVWELVRASRWKVKDFHIFCRTNCRDGETALAPPVLDPAGNLYGTTEFGGNIDTQWCPTSGGCGVAYQLESLGGGKWTYRVLHRFAAFQNDGQLPFAGLTVGSKGNVYGTTLYSGTSGGTVFKPSPQQDGHWKETLLYNFPSERNGAAPAGGVTFDDLGNLYGTASAGGDPTCSCGVVFKMTPQTNGKWSYTVLHRFKGNDGYGPGYNLIFDAGYKHLYGTTAAGGSGGYGVVYEFTPERLPNGIRGKCEAVFMRWSQLLQRLTFSSQTLTALLALGNTAWAGSG